MKNEDKSKLTKVDLQRIREAEFPELVESWPDPLRELELDDQAQLSDAELAKYEFEYLTEDTAMPNGMFV